MGRSTQLSKWLLVVSYILRSMCFSMLQITKQRNCILKGSQRHRGDISQYCYGFMLSQASVRDDLVSLLSFTISTNQS